MSYKILVIGDSCIDRFYYGKVNRISPECPTAILDVEYFSENEGMAGNVVANIKALDKTIKITYDTNEAKPQKARFVDEKSNYTLLRVDEPIDGNGKFMFNDHDYNDFDAVVVSDYAKGFLTKWDMERIADDSKLSFLDTKTPLGEWAQGFTFVKINEHEWSKSELNGASEINWRDQLIITKGKDGCDYNGENFKGVEVKIQDLSGAGDTFLAALVTKYLKTKDIKNSIIFANKIAAQVVAKKGVTTI